MKRITLLFVLLPFLGLSQVQVGQDINGSAAGVISGYDVELSQNGNFLVVSEPLASDNGTESGKVKVYENQSGIWTQIGSDITGDSQFNYFGWNVEIANNGNIIAISTPYNSNAGASAGHAKVYENQSGVWTQIGSDIEGLNNDQLGWGLSLSSDGSILAIGAPSNDANGSNSGHVKVYENQSGTWVQLGNEISGDLMSDQFGFSVDLSSDGSVVAIGTPFGLNSQSIASGYVKVYENQSGTWTQIGSKISGTAEFDQFGRDIELSNNGNRIIIGAPSNDPNNRAGFCQVYVIQSGVWVQLGSTLTKNINNDYFGNGVSISNTDDSVIAIGSRLENNNSGSTSVYKFIFGDWQQIGNTISGTNSGDQLGSCINLRSNNLAIGIPNSGVNGNNSGQTKVFNISNLLSIEENELSNFKLYPNPSKTQFTIQLDPSVQLEKVFIYNTLGQVVAASEETVVSTSKLASGSYIVEIITNQGKSSKKLIIE
ncbi:MAG: T9SS type A sorting domain-containing protein [Psychroserpens sp.]|uniref:T9SS type A sorting domain-containing protein n=1 Tax=Psychroserpens sp. TaxID=2020870 RepID=UPI003003854B